MCSLPWSERRKLVPVGREIFTTLSINWLQISPDILLLCKYPRQNINSQFCNILLANFPPWEQANYLRKEANRGTRVDSTLCHVEIEIKTYFYFSSRLLSLAMHHFNGLGKDGNGNMILIKEIVTTFVARYQHKMCTPLSVEANKIIILSQHSIHSKNHIHHPILFFNRSSLLQ